MCQKLKLEPKTIHSLLGEEFFIPAYQRGYRWKKRQIENLLDDIWEFQANADCIPKEGFYCLQPLVVSKNKGKWEVVDGQQRLTTIYIILSFLEKEHIKVSLEEAFQKPLFTLEYETRPDSAEYLRDINAELSDSNVDYYYINKAYQTIDSWFQNKDFNEKNVFLNILLSKEHKAVKVIWYDISDECKDNDYAIDVFTRINIGKIPLTNAELIKALFLGKIQKEDGKDQDHVDLKRLQIATEWDNIENSLQKDDFWHFIYNGTKNYDTRIEYIFDLMKSKKLNKDDQFYTFDKFNKQLHKENIDKVWLSVKKYFQRFEDWFHNRDFYHYIGFLIATGSSVSELVNQSAQKSKSEFKQFLVGEIKEKSTNDIDSLDYGENNDEIRKVLLLFNIQSLLNNPTSSSRFPFDYYKNGMWDLEHIHSIKSDKPVVEKQQREWLKLVLEYFIGYNQINEQASINNLPEKEKKIASQIEQALNYKESDFTAIYNNVMGFFNKSEESGEPEDIDKISNLTLLDSGTNRSYKNAPFPVKRKIILSKDTSGTFVPLCTKNVFIKAYSSRFDNLMYWQQQDRSKYLEAIKKTLADAGFIEKSAIEGDTNDNQ
ncbi:DUF262 domain-containing protein [Sedimentisphaera salicampi]|uniref:Uncharacterized protein n=1 Tax=Sedimentisphaera salicampi TaxID=1941349 RepID=A0A1W6LMN5_9BACT|nr:DUF262 domain-containing protein [Sedimentisphaera salicampi]ARN57012.1 hypothetical protein STSP1_01405 [Sedimentisphaera salicampi]